MTEKSHARTQTAVIMGLDVSLSHCRLYFFYEKISCEVLQSIPLFSDESTTREDEELVRKYSEKITRQTNGGVGVGQPQHQLLSKKTHAKNFLQKSRSNLPVTVS